jgi:hypothetical protein
VEREREKERERERERELRNRRCRSKEEEEAPLAIPALLVEGELLILDGRARAGQSRGL